MLSVHFYIFALLIFHEFWCRWFTFTWCCIKTPYQLGVYRIVGFRLFGRIRIRIRIALLAEHFDAAPAVLKFTTCLCPSLITAVPACCLVMTLSPSFVSFNQAVWARAAGTDWVKSAVDVSSSALCRLTIRIRSDDTNHPNMNKLFGRLFGKHWYQSCFIIYSQTIALLLYLLCVTWLTCRLRQY